MRHLPSLTRLLYMSMLMAALTAAGCSSTPKAADDAEAQSAAAPSASDDVAAEAEAYADRLAAAMTARHGSDEPPDVRWLEPGSEMPAQVAVPTRPLPIPEAADATPSPADPVQAAAEPVAAEPAPVPASINELLRQLQVRIEASDRPALTKALQAATLSLLDPSQPLDRRLLESLTFADQALVERYHQVMTLLLAQLDDGKAGLDRASIDARLDALFGQQPISIRTVQLCRRVMGYGLYEPFEGTTFLAGRDQKMIVYVELDDFQTREQDQEQFEVKLEQEISLFNESDGLAVWRNEAVQIVDASRNRRRDFFVVQLVTLPARLSVGKYRLKVRVTDLHGGSLDERTVPVEIVADESLVQR